MSKALIFELIGMVLGGIMIIGNQENPTVMIFTAVIMICSYMVFQSTLSPMTNVLSYFMSNNINRRLAVQQHEATLERIESKVDAVVSGDEQWKQ